METPTTWLVRSVRSRTAATLRYGILGHSSPTVTKTIYEDAARKVAQDAVGKLGFLFDK